MKILKYSASWCSPCKTLKTLLNGFDLFEIEDIDVDENPEKTLEYNVRNVPTLILIDEDEKELWRHSGIIDKVRLTLETQKFK